VQQMSLSIDLRSVKGYQQQSVISEAAAWARRFLGSSIR
jgi:hypothetical protein